MLILKNLSNLDFQAKNCAFLSQDVISFVLNCLSTEKSLENEALEFIGNVTSYGLPLLNEKLVSSGIYEVID